MYRRNLTATHKMRIANAMKGKKHTQATKDKISKAIKAQWDKVPPTEPTIIDKNDSNNENN